MLSWFWDPASGIEIFSKQIPFAIIFYFFIALGGLALLSYLLNIIFRKNVFKKINAEEDLELFKMTEIEQAKSEIDKEIEMLVTVKKQATLDQRKEKRNGK
ncbi:TIGR04561 family membrane protein [Mesoplasma photuris]|uniref:TIGR04561 family membrane protein n=1 Tax=Mesoplasma photuris TaxID=217731 RepID=UPI00146F95E0|nr:TIGR04561 family membrane protein [Mesoplasma photuris]